MSPLDSAGVAVEGAAANPAAPVARLERVARAWQLLATVTDPELPMLTILDLGIVRDVAFADDDALIVTITPTYSGCPAVTVIRESIVDALARAGLSCRVQTQLAPAWTTDWMSAEGRSRLAESAIAPPGAARVDSSALSGRQAKLACPRCGSNNTRMISRFGSTACKALHRCNDCLEPFDEFKPH